MRLAIRSTCALALIGLLTAAPGCSDPERYLPVIEALASAAPIIASAAPVALEVYERLKPSPTPTPAPTPTPRPVGLRAAIATLALQAGEVADVLPYLRTLEGLIPTEELERTVSNPAVVSLDRATGRARAVSAGIAVLSANLPGAPEAKAQVQISVLDKRLVQSVTVEPALFMLKPGESRPLSAQVRMVDGQLHGNVFWSSSDDTLASVNPTTGVVTAHRTGRVTIVASYALDTRYKGLAELSVGEAI